MTLVRGLACMHVLVLSGAECVPGNFLTCMNVALCVCVSGVSQKADVAPAAWAVKPALYPLLFTSLDLIYTCQGVLSFSLACLYTCYTSSCL